MMKICFVSSSGGHWEELMCLKPIADQYDSFYVTERGGQAEFCTLANQICLFPQINRHEKYFLMHFIRLFTGASKIMKREHPDLVITTGALIAFPFCVYAKMHNIKVIYIESFARISTASITGKLIYYLHLSDMFLVQWKSLLKIYPKAKYVGGIF